MRRIVRWYPSISSKEPNMERLQKFVSLFGGCVREYGGEPLMQVFV
jgi:hypothetical protein